ncbi:hypothetical protein [Clostridium sp. AF32-12BH]|uniref:hypothetical protein n=1 Tax=Clostridium sp. AF32-12BH TaxID=2292006 RepID=UPI000E46D3F6|nr:hypothetical protein [Clostridium sp. AF32-12BH]RHP46418.1 hypothetical protein DWZ40_10290 [Clostridium sp. AF32-12BH]
MKVKEFLRVYSGDNQVRIYDAFDFKSHQFTHVSEAIKEFGYYTVKEWNVIDDILLITISSQF